MGVVCFVFLIGSLRTNICFVGIFATLVVAFGLLTGAYFLLAEDYQGNAAKATGLIVVSFQDSSPCAYPFKAIRNANACHMIFRLVERSSLQPACLAGTSSLPSSWRLWTSPCHCLLGICPGLSSPKQRSCLFEGAQKFNIQTEPIRKADRRYCWSGHSWTKVA